MKRLLRPISLCAGALFLVAPLSAACDGYAAPTAHCATAATESMEMPGCHDVSVTSNDCCDVCSVPEQIAALSSKSAKPLVSLESSSCRATASIPETRPSLDTLADARCPYGGLGRYTLFSSLLL